MVRIVVVDDDAVNRDMLSRRLTKRGYEVVLAETGRQAVDAARAHRPDLILMDMGLPDMDGAEATRLIKAEPATGAVPVIALTAHAMEQDRRRAMDAGCNDYDTKPVDLERLLAKIRALTGGGAE